MLRAFSTMAGNFAHSASVHASGTVVAILTKRWPNFGV